MKKNTSYLKIISFTVFFWFVIVKVLLIGTAAYFDGLFAVSLSGDFFRVYTNLKFWLLNKLPELNNLVCLKRWYCNYVMQKAHE